MKWIKNVWQWIKSSDGGNALIKPQASMAPATPETELPASNHIFRHIKKSWMDGNFVEPAAFRLRQSQDGAFENGLSVNWVEHFPTDTPAAAIAPLVQVLENKGRTIGGTSKFAILNVGTAKEAAAIHTPISILFDPEEADPSHTLVTGYAAFNDQVAEELSKVVLDLFPVKPASAS